MKQKLYCFDFDGTLTTRDTMIELIKYAKGGKKFAMGFAANILFLVLMKLHLYPNWRCKERILAHFFGGMDIETFNKLCSDFASKSQKLIKPQAIAFINDIVAQGAKVIIVSASAENWVRPMIDKVFSMPPTITGTRLQVAGNKLTGKLLGNNCHGKEKVRRIAEFMASNKMNRHNYYIYAYGDSMGDKEMMEYADESFYRPF